MTTDKLIAALRTRAEFEDNGGVVELTMFDMGKLLREAADRLASTQVEGLELETTEEELLPLRVRSAQAAEAWADNSMTITQRMQRTVISIDGDLLHRLLRDHDRLRALAAAERDRAERMEGALRPFAFLFSPDEFTSTDGGCTTVLVVDEDVQIARAALAQDKEKSNG